MNCIEIFCSYFNKSYHHSDNQNLFWHSVGFYILKSDYEKNEANFLCFDWSVGHEFLYAEKTRATSQTTT